MEKKEINLFLIKIKLRLHQKSMHIHNIMLVDKETIIGLEWHHKYALKICETLFGLLLSFHCIVRGFLKQEIDIIIFLIRLQHL